MQSAPSEWKLSVDQSLILPQRYIFAVMGFLGLFNSFGSSGNFWATLKQVILTTQSDICFPNRTMEDIHLYHNILAEYNTEAQSLFNVLSLYFASSLIMHVPCGILVLKYGGKVIMSVGMLITSITTLITPVSIQYGGVPGLCVTRILAGVGMSAAFPALTQMLANWAPLTERATMAAIVYAGPYIGYIVSEVLTAVVTNIQNQQYIFYMFGALDLIWLIVFVLLCYENPESHPFIKQNEKEYLFNTLGGTNHRKKLKIPWKSIFTSYSVWAAVICYAAQAWEHNIDVIEMPRYMYEVLNISHNEYKGYMVPGFLVLGVTAILSGYLADTMANTRFLNITHDRKLFTSLSLFVPAGFWIIILNIKCDPTLFVTLLNLKMCIHGFFAGGFILTPLDISPNFACIIISIMEMFGALTGFITRIAVHLYLENGTLEEWGGVCMITSAVLIFSTIMYCLWGKNNVVIWNEPRIQRKTVDQLSQTLTQDQVNEL